jgi:four helix bundle protein
MTDKINSYRDLRVFQNAMKAAMKIFQLTENFPPEEKYSMTDQLRRSSRSVCANITRAWRKRRFKTPFIAKLNDSEGEACETYLDDNVCDDLDAVYNHIMGQLVKMINQPEKWLIKNQQKPAAGSPSS